VKKIILTGATSMLGVSFIEECLRRGDKVAAIIRPGSRKAHRVAEYADIKTVECDLREIEKLSDFLEGSWDEFYHLGWGPTDREGRGDPALQDSNVEFTLNAVRSAKKLGCSFFAGAGSQAEYGRVTGVIPPDRPGTPEVAYGHAKYAAGNMSALLCRDLGIRHVWARFFSVYGANDSSATMIVYCIEKLLRKEKPSLTACEQIWDYLYCADATRALYLLGEKGRDQSVYNIGSGIGRPLSEFVKIIRDTIDPGLELGFGDIPYQTGQVMHLCADIRSLTEDTGFIPEVSFEEGVKRTIVQLKKRKIKLPL